jgi:HSP20 family protein
MNCTNTAKFLRPAASIIEKPEGYIIEADLPGVPREGIELNVENDTLTIKGKRPVSASAGRILHRESRSLDYQRAFELGREIDRSRVTARFESGVLQVFLPKSEALKPRRVDVAG